MATTRTFSDMLNQYLPYDLLRKEFLKRMYLLENVKKSNDWKGGAMQVPFEGANPSTVSFGSLAASGDISEAEYVRGEVSTQPEVYFSLLFNEKDFIQHEGTKKDQSFLRSLKGQVPKALKFFKQVMSQNWLAGPHFATLKADGTAGGNITVDRPERFVRKQKVHLLNDTPMSATGFVDTINMDTSVIHLVTARGGAVDLDCSAFTEALNSKVYYQGLVDTGAHTTQNTFSSIKDSLLSNANGGGANLYGKAKATYPYLQAINKDGSSITATNILSELFDAYSVVDRKSDGMITEAWLSYKNFANCQKVIESSKGAYQTVPGSSKNSIYKWREIQVGSPSGQLLKLVALPEMDDDFIALMDKSSYELHTNGLFKYMEDPFSGDKNYRERATTGFTDIVDLYLMGDIILHGPSKNGIIHSIDY